MAILPIPHRWLRPSLLQVTAALLITTGLTPGLAPGQTSDAEPQLEASFGIVTWIGYTPLYIAQDQGFFEEAGLDLDVKVFNSGADLLAAFLADRVDGMSLVPSEAVTAANEGKAFQIVFIQDYSAGGDGLLARNSIESVADLAGQQIAVETHGVSHFFLLEILAEAGLSEEDVTLINAAPDAAAAAYQTDQVEAAVTYAPFLYTANEAQSDGRILYDSSDLAQPTSIANLYIFNSPFIADQPETITAFVTGLLQGLEFLRSNPEEGLAIGAERLGIRPEELEEQLQDVELPDLEANREILGDPDSDLYILKPLESLAEFLVEQGQLESAPDLSGVIDDQFVQDVDWLPEAGG